MSTKERILNEALEQMNTKGMENVSTYDIARALNIRQSNITYYFATKVDIVNALAKRMIEEVDQQLSDIDPAGFSFVHFYKMLDNLMKVHQKYDFIFMNHASIVTADRELNNHFVRVLKGRQEQFDGIIQLLDANGYVHGKEIMAHNTTMMLMLNMIIIYWVQEAAIYNAGKSDKAKRKHYLRLFFLVFLPYLTPKGKKELLPLL